MQLLRRAALVASIIAGFGLLFSFGVPVCPSAAVLRTPCPGCGLSRAAWALLQGDWSTAMTLNPASPLAVPVIGGILGWMMLRYVKGGRMGLPSWVAVPMIIVALALFIVWTARLFGAFGGPVAV